MNPAAAKRELEIYQFTFFDYGYDIIRELGRGAFGVTLEAIHQSSGQRVALKLVPRGSRIDAKVKREVKNQLCYDPPIEHPNIVKMYRVFVTPKHLVMVLEFCGGGDLFEALVSKVWPEDDLRVIFQQVVHAIDYLHSVGISHRDLKLENTLLMGKDSNVVKICDFGACKSASVDSAPHSVRGSMPYISPEIVAATALHKPSKDYSYEGGPADVWALGVLLYVLFTQSYPFQDPARPDNVRTTLDRIMNFNYLPVTNKNVPEDIIKLLPKIFAPLETRMKIQDLRRIVDTWEVMGHTSPYRPKSGPQLDSIARLGLQPMKEDEIDRILDLATSEGKSKRVAAQTSYDFSLSTSAMQDLVEKLDSTTTKE